jgi:hypothetical protein
MFRYIILSLLILWSAHVAMAQESWWDFYDLAMKDIRAKNWSLAEERLKSAFRLQSEQGPKVRTYGARFIRYFPEYYLGVVYFHQGKHQQALEEFLRVQNKGLIKQGDEEHAELTRLKQQSFAKLNPSSPPPEIPNTQQQYASLLDQAQKSLSTRNYEQAKNFANQADALGTNDGKAKDLLKKIELEENLEQLRAALDKNDLQLAQQISKKVETLDPGNSELDRLEKIVVKNAAEVETRKQFANLLDQAERQLSAGAYDNAKKLAQQAQSIPGADVSKVQNLMRQIEIQQASVKPPAADAEPFQELIKSANSAMTKNNFIEARRFATKANQVPGGNHQSIQDLLKRIELAENSSILESALKKKDWNSAQRAATNIAKIDSTHPILKNLPSIIEEGVGVLSFYSGQYEKSAKLLEQVVARPNSSAKAHFYLGCNYAALALLQQKTKSGMDQKQKLLKNAQQQFSASRQINPSLKYDQRFISPRILQIYERIH